MLRDANAVIEALRARKETLGLSNATVDELSGYTEGWWDKVCGPSRMKSPSFATLMAIAGALGLAVTLVEDPASVRTVQGRWRRRQTPGGNGRLSRLRRAKADAVTELARKGGNARWAGSTPEVRAATVARLNAARLAKRRAGTTLPAPHRPVAAAPPERSSKDRTPAATALTVFEAWAELRNSAPCPAMAKAALVERIICP